MWDGHSRSSKLWTSDTGDGLAEPSSGMRSVVLPGSPCGSPHAPGQGGHVLHEDSGPESYYSTSPRLSQSNASGTNASEIEKGEGGDDTMSCDISEVSTESGSLTVL